MVGVSVAYADFEGDVGGHFNLEFYGSITVIAHIMHLTRLYAATEPLIGCSVVPRNHMTAFIRWRSASRHGGIIPVPHIGTHACFLLIIHRGEVSKNTKFSYFRHCRITYFNLTFTVELIYPNIVHIHRAWQRRCHLRGIRSISEIPTDGEIK